MRGTCDRKSHGHNLPPDALAVKQPQHHRGFRIAIPIGMDATARFVAT